MAKVVPSPPHPHQEAINNLLMRVLPRIRLMPFAKNAKEPWLGNTTVDKAVLATIETIFNIADEDAKLAAEKVNESSVSSVIDPAAALGQPGMQTGEAFDEAPEMDQT